MPKGCPSCVPGRNCDPCRERSKLHMRSLRADPAYREAELARQRAAAALKRTAPALRFTPIRVGQVFGKLTVLEVLTASEAGHVRDGAWARCRCECRKRVLVRARHLRAGCQKTCGCGQPQALRFASAMRSLELGAA